MKQVFNLFAALLISAICFAQSDNTIIPELVFQNPVLVSGTAGKDNAVYKFSNVAPGIDATVTIKARSGANVVLSNIDVADMGWNKAFQPQLGIQGNVPANLNWWMDFEMRFYKAGTNEKKKIKGFSVTSIDVDGDGVSIQEYLQMNKTKSVSYCPVNYLIETTTTTTTSGNGNDDDDDKVGTDKKVVGPVMNYTNIDTLGTPVMATYKYENKDMISFRYGAKSGAVISNAGERLNSLWFKSFQLTAPRILPIFFYTFTATYDKKNITLNWTVDTDKSTSDFSIERSTDGENFTGIGSVKLAANPFSSYQFIDDNVSSKSTIVYYRIMARENTGEIKYSPIKVVRITKDQNLSLAVYPNPVQGVANLTLPYSWQNKPVTVSIYNGAGMLVQNISIKAASQTESVDFQHLSKGIYVVKAQCNNEIAEQKIIRN